MNAREFSWYQHRFLESTGLELWEAVEKFALPLWFFFESFDDLLELARNDEESFKQLITWLEWKLIKVESTITDKRITYAIAISLYNTHIDTRRRSIEESYISPLYISQDSARDILSQYGNTMSNPVSFIVQPEKIYKSILYGKKLEQPLTYVHNGKFNKPRPSWALASNKHFNQLDIETVHIEAYHPTVWYLLKEKKLTEYSNLFIKAIKLCETWIQNSILKPQKINEV